jgi:hypothetical protein
VASADTQAVLAAALPEDEERHREVAVSIAVLVITDGRDEYLHRTVESARGHLAGPITEWWMYDDTGDDIYRDVLARHYPTFRHVNAGPRQGFGGAIRAAWDTLDARSSARYVLHLEQDFTFRQPVDLAVMAEVLDAQPHIVQMALRRQAWNEAERAAGGVVELNPDAFHERRDDQGRAWLEHRLWWTTNPSLYRRSLCATGWPPVRYSEGVFGLRLLDQGSPEAGPDEIRFGYWGDRASGEWVEHIGHSRAGEGY